LPLTKIGEDSVQESKRQQETTRSEQLQRNTLGEEEDREASM